MPRAGRVRITLIVAVVATIAMSGGSLCAQPDPYHTLNNWAHLPDGRRWGWTVGISVDRSDNVWVFERCGANTCDGSSLAPILEFDPSGNLLKSFGAGMFVSPHGLSLDKDGNVWVTDYGQGKGKGEQVVGFSPEGKVLLTLGKAGVAGDGPDTFNKPSAVAVAPNGDIFVADGHGGDSNARIVKFSKDGRFIKAWGRKGSAPGEFDNPHAVAIDSKGRLFVGDTNNNRIQIFDQNGKFLTEWKQFGRPSGIFIDAKDNIYVADFQSDAKRNPGFKPGIRIGSAKDGSVKYFIPALGPEAKPTSVTEGVAADSHGNIYGAESETMNVRKYVKE
jgi:hypothetical protein